MTKSNQTTWTMTKSTTDSIGGFQKTINSAEANRKVCSEEVNGANISIYSHTVASFNAYNKDKIRTADMKALREGLKDAGLTEASAKRKAEKTQWVFVALRKENKKNPGYFPTQATPEFIQELFADLEIKSESKLTSHFNPKKPLTKAQTIIRSIFGEMKEDKTGMKGGLDAKDYAEFKTLFDAEVIAREERVQNEAEAEAKKESEINAQDETADAMDEIIENCGDDIPNAQDDLDNNPFHAMQ